MNLGRVTDMKVNQKKKPDIWHKPEDPFTSKRCFGSMTRVLITKCIFPRSGYHFLDIKGYINHDISNAQFDGYLLVRGNPEATSEQI